MASVVLPAWPLAAVASPRFLDFGAQMDAGPSGSGPRIHRLGNRYAIDFMMPPMWLERHRGWGDGGRVFLSRLQRAKMHGARFPWPQPGLVIGAVGLAPRISVPVNANVEIIQVQGFRPRYVIREGQFFTIEHDGIGHLHHVTDEVLIGADGRATLPIFPRLRTRLFENDALDPQAYIEGRILGDDLSWTLTPSRQVQPVSFSIEEYGVKGSGGV